MKKHKLAILMIIGLSIAVMATACKKTDNAVPTETETETSEEATEPTTEEAAEPDEEDAQTMIPEDGKVTIYVGNSDADGLDKIEVEAEKITAEILVEQLIEKSVLKEGTELISFEIDGDLGTLNISDIPVYGTSGEMVMLDSIGNTFIEAYKIEKLRLLINGKNYESGHLIYGDEDYLYYKEN